ncbi:MULTISPECIES: hypothetical protein [Pseudomonas]|uniref:DUF4376 domain-containing protein n=1 Tax=Pseudomonas TaxID=286 RepID=UPI000CD3CE17|nr:hypothetical protein [Pseudomonas putida]POF86244.1 hypothetical protein BGP81_28155 [Pseudomonas putida]RFQ02122.1 hypothetical protein D0O09_13095 [Pseudomonas putida]
MAIFYSDSEQAFFNSSIHMNLPDDCVEISKEVYGQLLVQRAAGKQLVLNDDGQPVAIDVTIPTEDLLNRRYQDKIEEINKACEAAIFQGFESNALGAPHLYSSTLEDQLNLTGAIQRGAAMPFPCWNAEGIKAFRDHSIEQLQQVGDDFTDFKMQLLQRAHQLKGELDTLLAAGDQDGIEAIAWTA